MYFCNIDCGLSVSIKEYDDDDDDASACRVALSYKLRLFAPLIRLRHTALYKSVLID